MCSIELFTYIYICIFAEVREEKSRAVGAMARRRLRSTKIKRCMKHAHCISLIVTPLAFCLFLSSRDNRAKERLVTRYVRIDAGRRCKRRVSHLYSKRGRSRPFILGIWNDVEYKVDCRQSMSSIVLFTQTSFFQWPCCSIRLPER